MSVQKALIKISLKKETDVFLVSEYVSEKTLTLKILNIIQNESYVGHVSVIDLRKQAARIRLTFSEFLREIKNALFQTPSNEYTYIYSLEKESENYIFKWKSMDKDETIINLGNVLMKKQDHAIIFDEVLLGLAKELMELYLKIENYELELKKYKTQTSDALNQLVEATEIKESFEKEMFSKFLLVINEKKKMLKEIKNQCSVSKAKNIQSKVKTNKKNRISLSEDEDEFLNEPGPSTSGKRNSELFLDDDDESVVPVRPSKVRNRKVGTNVSSDDRLMNLTSKSMSCNVLEDDNDDFLLNNL